ncbi:hypothetical protein [Catellatospora citrea]|uniref:Uncharacterized protein n=1 Tax=Catellatospora citrea TaxID=53366 RepID=A0A8J3KGN0_9ACTN|nr:hypothetical protein [Catellatospora citrea]RKE11114.1 hypothetical protein C8E86_6036 [Catellatospora citrea]GIF96573.1 hypothetical protein Cci01nite_16670 [Catellatospora citrea]
MGTDGYAPWPICGRPTKAKTTCKMRVVRRYLLTCEKHMTEAERLALPIAEAAEREGYERGVATTKMGENAAREHAKRLAAELAELKEAATPTRMRTQDGRQIVTVSTGYAYAAPAGREFGTGDKVHVAAPFWHGAGAAPQLVEVTALGTKYTGSLANCW